MSSAGTFDHSLPITAEAIHADLCARNQKAEAIAAHNARVYRDRTALMRRNMMSGSGFHAHGAPQLLDAKWSASEARETKGTFRVDASTAALWQKAIRRESAEDHQGATAL